MHVIPPKNCPIPVSLSKNDSYFFVLYIPHNTKITPKSINASFKIIVCLPLYNIFFYVCISYTFIITLK